MSATHLPEWSSAFDDDRLARVRSLPLPARREWALAGATGEGVDVAVVDSGVDADNPRVGGLAGSVALVTDAEDPRGYRVEEGPHTDLVGHGNACSGIIRSLAPRARLHSVRVLGANLRGRGVLLRGGIEWSVAAGMRVVNLSLSSKSDLMYADLHRVTDAAYFRGALLVCAANNSPGPTYPSEFASVVSVAARAGDDPLALAYNPHPPVEFAARGIDLDVAWADGGSTVATGNSFAAPHVSGLTALLLSKHPWLTPFQVKAVLHSLCDNADVS
ncbi:S8 family serine peptidase [Aquipuribacter sp. SD81]|uniref:S8 family serine peptidase n=1 Tax=Aquipuribacter sp. SD81 TaxID=3127703 RepID=UPI00301B15AE